MAEATNLVQLWDAVLRASDVRKSKTSGSSKSCWQKVWSSDGKAGDSKASRGVKLGEETLFLRQLTKKFGPLSESVIARVHAADAEQLLVWGERLLTAATMDDVFGPIQ